MKIFGKRIRVLENYLVGIADQEEFYIVFSDLTNLARLQQIGFSPELNMGEEVLPAKLKSVSRFNSDGGFIRHKNLAKETVYREALIKDWHGNYHIVDIPYQRYPRTLVPAPEIRLLIVEDLNSNKIIRSPLFKRGNTPNSLIIHTINLFLELFGECDTYKPNLLPVFNLPVNRLNWQILPQGNYPWAILRNNLQQVIGSVNGNRRQLIEHRLQVISNHTPNFVAVGTAGFYGYFVFGFPGKNFFVLESLYTGNATYIFDNNWPNLSQMTKEQILNQNLHLNRLIHTVGWENRLDLLF